MWGWVIPWHIHTYMTDIISIISNFIIFKLPAHEIQLLSVSKVDDVVCESELLLRIQAELAVHLQRNQRAYFLVMKRHIACGADDAADGIDPLSKAGGRQ